MISWSNKCVLSCLIVLAFEPMLSHYKIYFGLMMLVIIVVFLSVVFLIISALTGGISTRDCVEKFSRTPIIHWLVYALGLIISFAYESNMFNFWIFLVGLELLNRLIYYYRKERE